MPCYVKNHLLFVVLFSREKTPRPGVFFILNDTIFLVKKGLRWFCRVSRKYKDGTKRLVVAYNGNNEYFAVVFSFVTKFVVDILTSDLEKRMDSNSKSTLLPENLSPKDEQVQGRRSDDHATDLQPIPRLLRAIEVAREEAGL